MKKIQGMSNVLIKCVSHGTPCNYALSEQLNFFDRT